MKQIIDNPNELLEKLGYSAGEIHTILTHPNHEHIIGFINEKNKYIEPMIFFELHQTHHHEKEQAPQEWMDVANILENTPLERLGYSEDETHVILTHPKHELIISYINFKNKYIKPAALFKFYGPHHIEAENSLEKKSKRKSKRMIEVDDNESAAKKNKCNEEREDLEDFEDKIIFETLLGSSFGKIDQLIAHPVNEVSQLQRYLDKHFKPDDEPSMEIFRTRICDIATCLTESITAMRFLMLLPSTDSCYLLKFFESLNHIEDDEKRKNIALSIFKACCQIGNLVILEWLVLNARNFIYTSGILEDSAHKLAVTFLNALLTRDIVERLDTELESHPVDAFILTGSKIEYKGKTTQRRRIGKTNRNIEERKKELQSFEDIDVFNVLLSNDVNSVENLVLDSVGTTSKLQRYLDRDLNSDDEVSMAMFRKKIADIVLCTSRNPLVLRSLILFPSTNACYLKKYFESLDQIKEENLEQYKEELVSILAAFCTAAANLVENIDVLRWLVFYANHSIYDSGILDKCHNKKAMALLQKILKQYENGEMNGEITKREKDDLILARFQGDKVNAQENDLQNALSQGGMFSRQQPACLPSSVQMLNGQI